MNIIIQSPHFKARPELKNFVNTKVRHLNRLHDRILSADVCLKFDKSAKRDNKVCEIKLDLPGNNLFAKNKSNTFEEAVVLTVDALQQQIKKAKPDFLEK